MWFRWQLQGTERGTERVEAFSDGVFAIAITLLILEVKIPLHPDSDALNLASALLHLWPAYLAYLFSFIVIGIYWANHHYLFKLFRRTNHMLNWLNLLLLLCVAFLLLPSAVLGNYLLDVTNHRTAIIFYEIGILLPACAWTLMWWYASNNPAIIHEQLDCAYLRSLTFQYLGSVGIYLLAMMISCCISPAFGLLVSMILTLSYLFPPLQPRMLVLD